MIKNTRSEVISRFFHLDFIIFFGTGIGYRNKAMRNLTRLDMVLLTLQLYATGCFQTLVCNVLRVSQSTVTRSVSVMSAALSVK